ncbi:MAG TPA: hypothetical protein VF485_04985 [Sphingomonas sp.]
MKLVMLGVLGLRLAVTAMPNAATAATAATRSAIEGSWQTACQPIGKNGRHGFITRLDIKRGRITASSQIYAHSNCDTPTVRTDYRGRIANMQAGADGTVDFDHRVDAITTTANDQEVVTIYNAGGPGSGCGFGGGWQLGVARSVAGRTCAPWTFPAAGTTLYERGWVSGNELRIGSFPGVWDNVTREKRPTAPGLLVFKRVAE